MNGAAYGTYTNTYSTPTEPIDVMTIGEAVVWGGRRHFMDKDMNWALRIRLNDDYGWRTHHQLVRADEGARQILPAKLLNTAYPPTVDIDWSDFGVPELDGEWWKDLVEAIRGLGDADVAVYCDGGHGRTGTALSLLAFFSGACGKEDPVAWVRQVYDDDAVESSAQMAYIEKVTGVKSTEMPASMLHSTFMSAEGTYEWQKDDDGIWRKHYLAKADLSPRPGFVKEPETTSVVHDAHIQSQTIAKQLGLDNTKKSWNLIGKKKVKK